jgi:hypothetical protein
MHIKNCGFAPSDRTELFAKYGLVLQDLQCQYNDCRWVFNEQTITPTRDHRTKETPTHQHAALLKVGLHYRKYHNQGEHPVEGKFLYTCGYCMIYKRPKTNKEAKSLVTRHMEACGYDDMDDIAGRRAQYDGLGVCNEPDCTWVCRTIWYEIRHLRSSVKKHKTTYHT